MTELITKKENTSRINTYTSPLDEFNNHRKYNQAIASYLCNSELTRDIGIAISNCSHRLNLEFELNNGSLSKAKLINAFLCNRRLCPFCEWRRTRVWRARLIKGIYSLQEEIPKTKAIFLTLTSRNCELYELRETISHLHSSFKRLTLIHDFPSKFWFRRTEVTVSRKSINGRPAYLPSLHPHIYCLLLVRPSYWTHGYWSKLRWQSEWQMAGRFDYSPIVDIRRARYKNETKTTSKESNLLAIIEAAKYSTKSADLIRLRELLPQFHTEMKNLRLYGVSGGLRKYISECESKRNDLLDQSKLNEDVFSAIANWFNDIQEYKFII